MRWRMICFIQLIFTCSTVGSSLAAPSELEPGLKQKQGRNKKFPGPIIRTVSGFSKLKKAGADKLQIRIDDSGWGKSIDGWPTKKVFFEGLRNDAVVWSKIVPMHRSIDVDAINSVSAIGSHFTISSNKPSYTAPLAQEFSWDGKSIRFLKSSWCLSSSLFPIGNIIDEDTDGWKFCSKDRRMTIELSVEKRQLVTTVYVGTFQGLAILGLGAKASNFHRASSGWTSGTMRTAGFL